MNSLPETHTVLLELWDALNLRLDSLEQRIRSLSEAEHLEAGLLADALCALHCVIRGQPLQAGSLAALLLGARALWTLEQEKRR